MTKRTLKNTILILMVIATTLYFTRINITYAVGTEGGDVTEETDNTNNAENTETNSGFSADTDSDETQPGEDQDCNPCPKPEPDPDSDPDSNNSNGGGDGEDDNDDTPGGDGGDKIEESDEFIDSMHCTFQACSITYGVTNQKMTVTWDLYDMFNEPLKSSFGVLSGTYMGANLCEKRQATYYGHGLGVYDCEKIIEIYHEECTTDKRGNVVSCRSWQEERIEHVTKTQEHAGCNNTALHQGYNSAVAAITGGASYTVDIYDPNEAKCFGKEDGYKYGSGDNEVCTTYQAVAVGEKPTSYYESRQNGNNVIKNYCYELYGACINAKSGKVEYLTSPVNANDENPCRDKGEEWYYVKNETDSEQNKHWHVFIPLNTKETDNYKFIMKANNKETSVGICTALIKKYSKNHEYAKYISPSRNGSFNTNLPEGSIQDAINKVEKAGGCYYNTNIDIKIKQRFYNEVSDDKNSKKSEIIGFNFYYRPIDITNPFPNGITKYSDWEKWGEDEKINQEDPEIDKSFNTVTYATTNINLDFIRNYNKENLYTDWSKMSINGGSMFITSQNIINRNSTITKDSFYSLGCGVENQCEYLDSKHTIKNPIYQPRCKNNKKGEICP